MHIKTYAHIHTHAKVTFGYQFIDVSTVFFIIIIHIAAIENIKFVYVVTLNVTFTRKR